MKKNERKNGMKERVGDEKLIIISISGSKQSGESMESVRKKKR